jgi:ATP-dependent Zn protease
VTVRTKRIAFLALFAAINLLAWLAFRRYADAETPSISYSRFLNEVEAGQVARVRIEGQTRVTGDYLDNRGRFRTRVPSNDPDLYWTLRENGVDMEIDEGGGVVRVVGLVALLAAAAALAALLTLRRERSRSAAEAQAREHEAFQSL